jgi:TonB family protein
MSNPDTWKAWEGRIVDGRFPLRRWLGSSDHSTVFLTERPDHASEKAAIKLIGANAPEADRILARWRASAQLSHPHLIRIFDGGRARLDDTPILYVVMELAEEDLSQILPQRALTPAEVTDLLPPLLDSLTYLHEKGLVHGRITPSNVLAASDQLKLSADQIHSASEVNPEVSLGEANSREAAISRRRDVFDAPETAAGIVTPAGDLWAVGITVVAALMQKVPSAGGDAQLDPGLLETMPPPFRGIVRECLHLDPKRRCSIADIRARLQPAGRSVPAAEMTRAAKSSTQHYRYSWRLLIPVAVLLVFVLGLRVFYKGTTKPAANTLINATTGTTASKAPPAAAPESLPVPFSSTKPAADPKGEVLRKALPEVPKSAQNTITGTIKIGVRVEADSSGKVTAAKLASAGPSRYFANLAVKAAERWEFSPPQVNGQPVPSTWMLRFRLRRNGTDVTPERVTR